jgi:hypothetical protein
MGNNKLGLVVPSFIVGEVVRRRGASVSTYLMRVLRYSR